MVRVDSGLTSTRRLFAALVLPLSIWILAQGANLIHGLFVNAAAIEVGKLTLAGKSVSPEVIAAVEDWLRTAWDRGYDTPGTGRFLARAREIRTGQPDFSLVQTIAQRFPADPLVQYESGRVLRLEGDEEAAIAAYTRARAIGQLLEWAQAQRQAESWDSAVRLYQSAFDVGGERFETLQGLGWATFRATGEVDTAVRWLKSAAALRPQDVYTYHLIVQVYYESGRYHEALVWADETTGRFPYNPQGVLDRSLILSAQGRAEDALALLMQAVDTYPENDQIYFRLGQWYHERGQYTNAVAYYQRAIALRPSVWWYHRHLADVLLALGQRTAALEEYRAASTIAPGIPEVESKIEELTR